MIGCISRCISPSFKNKINQSKWHFSYGNELIWLASNPNISRRLEILKNLCKYNLELCAFFRLDERRLTALGRSFEIFENFKKTHFIFHHGQSSLYFLTLNILKINLLFRNNLDNFSKFSCSLRHPASLKNLDENIHKVEWYKNRLTGANLHKENDRHHKVGLLAVDGYLASTAFAESALSFFGNVGINEASRIGKQQEFSEILDYQIQNHNNRLKFLKRFNDLEEELFSKLGQRFYSEGAMLYTICIPKNNFSNCGYLSWPFGIPHKINQNEVYPLLEKMQNEEEPGKDFPQVRLLTHLLQANNAQTFMFTTMPDDELEMLIAKIRELVQSSSHIDSLKI